MTPVRILAPAAALATALAAGTAAAHPHVFVDTALRIVLDDRQQVTGIEVTWTYDELYSMLTFEDLGVDNDFDGRLSDAETAHITGFDMNWIEGFEGDLYLSTPGGAVALGRPETRALKVENAMITTTHFRPLSTPVSAQDLVVRAYDPTFYTAYALAGVSIDAGCAAEIEPADLDAAYSRLEELLFATPESEDPDSFPEVGAAFADTVRVTCGR